MASPSAENVAELLKKFPESSTAPSIDRFKDLRKAHTRATPKQVERHDQAVQDLQIQYMYPRIDTEVSRKLNHLLKAPFCIHPGTGPFLSSPIDRSQICAQADRLLCCVARTGKVCVPILASQIDSFDPDTVPTVGKLLLELEELSRRGDTAADWGKTSLRPYVELFERHAEAVAKEKAREVKGESAGVEPRSL